VYTATKVYFCHQTWEMDSEIQLIDRNNDYLDIVTKETPFHPVSHIWPDHPADSGILRIHQDELKVIDCQVGAIELSTGSLYVGQNIPVKRNTEGWCFVVVHRLQACAVSLKVGERVRLCVDQQRQHGFSLGHSAGHIASLALNQVLAEGYWRKVPDRVDGLGHYDFNRYAQQRSVVSTNKCWDHYRLGKTLKKRGLNTKEVITDLKQIESQVNALVDRWLSKSASIQMRLEGDELTDSRFWECTIGDVLVSMPCGGTHITDLTHLHPTRIELQLIDDSNVEMHTYAIRKPQ
jgi:alanyl-tRNA synthetase